MSCSYTFLVEKHTIGLVKFVELGFVSYIVIFNACHNNVSSVWCGSKWVCNSLGVHEVATTYNAILYETILLLFLV